LDVASEGVGFGNVVVVALLDSVPLSSAAFATLVIARAAKIKKIETDRRMDFPIPFSFEFFIKAP
jgi:hypothetical protein